MKFLTCFFCDKEFQLNDIFLAFSRFEDGNEGVIIHCQCIPCADQRPNTEPEKRGGWAVLKRALDGYIDAQE